MGHIHSESQYDYTASGYIIHDNKILLLLHHTLKLWLPPAGHIELNETPIEGLYREIEEESGIKKDQLTLILPYSDNLSFNRDETFSKTQPLPFDIDVHPIGDLGHQHIDFSYILMSDTADFTLEDNAATDMKWITFEELKLLSPAVNTSTISRAAYAFEKVAEVKS